MSQAILDQRPTLSAYESGFYQAFGELSTMRNFGMAAGPIPVDKIWAWADRNELSRLQAEILQRVIMAMDRAYMVATAKRRSQSSK